MRGDSYRVNRRIRKRSCGPRTAKSCRGCKQATLPNPFQEFPSAGIAATISGFVIRFHCHPNPLEVCVRDAVCFLMGRRFYCFWLRARNCVWHISFNG